jgi:pyrroloquinoline-quinone synthase
MNSLIKKIDDMIEERSLLKHPFYEMWSDGKLKLESLAGYSKEYFQLVKAVPSFMSPIIEQA